jgi:hypothetical protein
MRWSTFGFALAALAGINQASAMCVDGTVSNCTVNGKHGTRECVGGRFTPCLVEEGQPGGQQGTLMPKYYVLTVAYAPPGTQGGHSSSSVTYGSGSTTGTTTSASQSFKQNYSISVTAGGGFLGSAQAGVSFSYGHSATDNKSLDVKKSATTTIRVDGPSQDGVNHDHDVIYLWLNPKINLVLTSNSAAWTFSGTDTAEIQYVYVGWLKAPSTMPPGVVQALQRHGITQADFPDILKRDQFAGSVRRPPIFPILPHPLDPVRFQSVHTTFPYEPPFSATDSVPTYSFNLTGSVTSAAGHTAQDDYKVGVTISAGVDFLGLAKSSLKTDDSWDWTNTSSTSNSSASTQSASVTIGGPAFGYTGPTEMEVYFDTVYSTFLFRPLEPGTPLAVEGMLKSRAGKPVPRKEVTIVANGVTYRTFTNAKGEYRFFGKIHGPVKLQSSGVIKSLPSVAPSRPIELRMQ